ncbi:hypothetical protein ACJJTC_000050 [Scirpophaga incertulas]
MTSSAQQAVAAVQHGEVRPQCRRSATVQGHTHVGLLGVEQAVAAVQRGEVRPQCRRSATGQGHTTHSRRSPWRRAGGSGGAAWRGAAAVPAERHGPGTHCTLHTHVGLLGVEQAVAAVQRGEVRPQCRRSATGQGHTTHSRRSPWRRAGGSGGAAWRGAAAVPAERHGPGTHCTLHTHVGLLGVEQAVAAVQRGEVRPQCRRSATVQGHTTHYTLTSRGVAEVRGVHVRHHVEQQPQHAPHHALEHRRELVRCGAGPGSDTRGGSDL